MQKRRRCTTGTLFGVRLCNNAVTSRFQKFSRYFKQRFRSHSTYSAGRYYGSPTLTLRRVAVLLQKHVSAPNWPTLIGACANVVSCRNGGAEMDALNHLIPSATTAQYPHALSLYSLTKHRQKKAWVRAVYFSSSVLWYLFVEKVLLVSAVSLTALHYVRAVSTFSDCEIHMLHKTSCSLRILSHGRIQGGDFGLKRIFQGCRKITLR